MSGDMNCYGSTEIGMLRPCNEDQFLIAALKKSVLIHRTSLSNDEATEWHGSSQVKLQLAADGVARSPGSTDVAPMVKSAYQRIWRTWRRRPFVKRPGAE